jgi:hypothetical protein
MTTARSDDGRWHFEVFPSLQKEVLGNRRFLHPTHVVFSSDKDGEEEKVWTSRDHRKHRHLPTSPQNNQARKADSVVQKILNMRHLEVWNISWWVAMVSSLLFLSATGFMPPMTLRPSLVVYSGKYSLGCQRLRDLPPLRQLLHPRNGRRRWVDCLAWSDYLRIRRHHGLVGSLEPLGRSQLWMGGRRHSLPQRRYKHIWCCFDLTLAG